MTIVANDLYTRLQDLFSTGEATLTDGQKAIADKELITALNIIKSEMLLRGATLAQVDLWLRLDEFYLDIATFNTIMSLGKDTDEEDKHAAWAKIFDRRAELKSVDIVLIDGTIITDEEETADDLAAARPVAVFNLRTMNKNLGI